MNYVYTKINQQVATIEFASEQANALSIDLLHQLAKELNTISDNDQIKVVLLQSGGEKTFCAGAFFDELVQVDSLESGKNFFSGFAVVLNAIRNCKKVVIGRAQGKAVGGGVGILSTCDYVFATENASIRLPELSIGIGPFVIAPAVQRKIGVGALSELSFTPDQWKNAYWAEKKGLYARVFENIQEMDKEIQYFVEKLSSYPSNVLSEIKQILWKDEPSWENVLFDNAQISGKLALSEFTKEKLKHKNK
ncbi:MAG: enoyl-CoA hydratase/isomerase family protein [Capnocytophaga sp.]|nr:enoyl-CoA hydratase/isomerase family protein [Capnocytophaga sp.]